MVRRRDRLPPLVRISEKNDHPEAYIIWVTKSFEVIRTTPTRIFKLGDPVNTPIS